MLKKGVNNEMAISNDANMEYFAVISILCEIWNAK